MIDTVKDNDFSFKQIVDHAKDVVIVTKANLLDDPGPEIVYVNEAFTELTGYSAEEAIGKSPRMLQGEDTSLDTTKKIREGLEQQRDTRVTIKNYAKSGREYWLDLSIFPVVNDQGEVTHFAAIERDVTKQKMLEFKLDHLSRTDPLTGLLNRRAFSNDLKREYSRFKRGGDPYSMILIDIDDFKNINDSYGHANGDIAIKRLAQICKDNLRLHDTTARMGGEEFCVLLPRTDKKTAYLIAEKLRKLVFETPISTELGDIAMTISAGVSVVSSADVDDEALFKRADASLYLAKESGRNSVCQ